MAVYKWTKEGKLPYGVKIGKSRRWNLEEVRAFLQKKENN